MKTISLWQPWATAIAIGAKQIETRAWYTSYRGILAIHAAKKKDELGSFDRPATPGQTEVKEAFISAGYVVPEDFPLGAIVAVVELTACWKTEYLRAGLTPIEEALGGYDVGRFGWMLKDLRKLRQPLPWKGSQGFFDVPDELIRANL